MSPIMPRMQSSWLPLLEQNKRKSVWRPIQPVFWKLKRIEKKTKKSLASSSAWPDWNSQSFKAIHTFAKSGRIKKGQSIKTAFG